MIKKNDNNSKWTKVEKKNYNDMGKKPFRKAENDVIEFLTN
jgi:hypothetical protein